jgi:hypothetical protein
MIALAVKSEQRANRQIAEATTTAVPLCSMRAVPRVCRTTAVTNFGRLANWAQGGCMVLREHSPLIPQRRKSRAPPRLSTGTFVLSTEAKVRPI